MKAPVTWIREHAALPEGTTTQKLADALESVGLELEAVERGAAELAGPIVVGRVLSFDVEPQKNGKNIRWCCVDVGPEHNPDGEPGRGIICGAQNFAVGDLVVAALPGAVLPGPYEISSRKTYGHVSDGMLCAVDELGLGTDHDGIVILPTTAGGHSVEPGADALEILGAREDVLDLGVTPDMGYCQSIRGLAREAAQALGGDFTDPIPPVVPQPSHAGHPVRLEAAECPYFVALTIEGFDPAAPSPEWMQRRLRQAGMRSISLAVDVTNYVMLETGQPLHAYDADRLHGTIVVRKAAPGERLTTLDGVDRALDCEDLVIADGSGAIGLAGLMGGATTEVTDTTTRLVLEAAYFDAATIARASRRHQLTSEASRRFERGADPVAPYAAAHRAAELLLAHGGGRLLEAETVAGEPPLRDFIVFDPMLPSRVLGRDIPAAHVMETLARAGSGVTDEGRTLVVTPPTWRPDLREPIDLVEEVGRKTGLDAIPARLPRPVGGHGLTVAQQRRRELGRALAAVGLVEVTTLPFVADAQLDALQVAADDPRRSLVRIANPLSEEFPAVRSTLLPGLLEAVARNASRSQDDVALFEIGRVFRHTDESATLPAPDPGIDGRPADEVLAEFERSLPAQPRHVGAVVAGAWRAKDWRGPAQPSGWEHAFALADQAAAVYGVRLQRRAANLAPWHPGRCAELVAGGAVVGVAGELHPHVCRDLSLPPRAAGFELDLEALLATAPGPGRIGMLSRHPVVKEDVALIVDQSVTAAQLESALREGAGELLESVALFDVYTGPQVGQGRRSYAFALRFRADDRTLKQDEVTQARTAAVARAVELHGAEQRLA